MELFKKTDPLIKIFLNQYGMNLLQIPREDVSIGDLYIYDPRIKAVSSKGSITYFLTPEPKIPELTLGASMADLTDTATKEVDFNAGLNLVSSFLEKFGVGLILGKVKADYESKGAKTIKFSFPKAEKDSVDSMHLAKNLIDTKPILNHPFYSRNNRYFIVMATAKTSALTIAVQDKSKRNADIDVKALNQELASANTKIDKDSNSAITFNGRKKLVFAVELQELLYDEKAKKIQLKPSREYIKLKGKRKGATPQIKKQPGIDDSVFINLI